MLNRLRLVGGWRHRAMSPPAPLATARLMASLRKSGAPQWWIDGVPSRMRPHEPAETSSRAEVDEAIRRLEAARSTADAVALLRRQQQPWPRGVYRRLLQMPQQQQDEGEDLVWQTYMDAHDVPETADLVLLIRRIQRRQQVDRSRAEEIAQLLRWARDNDVPFDVSVYEAAFDKVVTSPEVAAALFDLLLTDRSVVPDESLLLHCFLSVPRTALRASWALDVAKAVDEYLPYMCIRATDVPRYMCVEMIVRGLLSNPAKNDDSATSQAVVRIFGQLERHCSITNDTQLLDAAVSGMIRSLPPWRDLDAVELVLPVANKLGETAVGDILSAVSLGMSKTRVSGKLYDTLSGRQRRSFTMWSALFDRIPLRALNANAFATIAHGHNHWFQFSNSSPSTSPPSAAFGRSAYDTIVALRERMVQLGVEPSLRFDKAVLQSLQRWLPPAGSPPTARADRVAAECASILERHPEIAQNPQLALPVAASFIVAQPFASFAAAKIDPGDPVVEPVDLCASPYKMDARGEGFLATVLDRVAATNDDALLLDTLGKLGRIADLVECWKVRRPLALAGKRLIVDDVFLRNVARVTRLPRGKSIDDVDPESAPALLARKSLLTFAAVVGNSAKRAEHSNSKTELFVMDGYEYLFAIAAATGEPKLAENLFWCIDNDFHPFYGILAALRPTALSSSHDGMIPSALQCERATVPVLLGYLRSCPIERLADVFPGQYSSSAPLDAACLRTAFARLEQNPSSSSAEARKAISALLDRVYASADQTMRSGQTAILASLNSGDFMGAVNKFYALARFRSNFPQTNHVIHWTGHAIVDRLEQVLLPSPTSPSSAPIDAGAIVAAKVAVIQILNQRFCKGRETPWLARVAQIAELSGLVGESLTMNFKEFDPDLMNQP